MNYFFLDASALVKRYTPETGKASVDYLFAQAEPARMSCLMLGGAEVTAALVRKRNSGVISPGVFNAAMFQLRAEILDEANFPKLASDNSFINLSLPVIEKHSISAIDAILLKTALDLASQFRTAGDDLVLVAADQRLLKAAQAEGLTTYDPESQDQAALDALLAS